jgi:hypothetical protein
MGGALKSANHQRTNTVWFHSWEVLKSPSVNLAKFKEKIKWWLQDWGGCLRGTGVWSCKLWMARVMGIQPSE